MTAHEASSLGCARLAVCEKTLSMAALPAPQDNIADISVVIPTLNRCNDVIRAIASVLEQTLQARELIIVDDGSVDATAKALRERWSTMQLEDPEPCATALNPDSSLPPGQLEPSVPEPDYDCDGDGDGRAHTTLRLLRQENRGVSAARNLGITAARSNWIAFLDSDDRWLPEKLRSQWAVAKGHDSAELIHTDEIWIRKGVRVNAMNKHQKRGGHIYEHCLPMCRISPSATMMHRRALHRIGGFDVELPACEDYDLWLKFCATHPVHFVEAPLVVKYGGHDDQLSRQHWGMDRFRVRALWRMLDEKQLSPTQHQATVEVLSRKLQILRQGAHKRGKIEAAEQWQQQWARAQEHITP